MVEYKSLLSIAGIIILEAIALFKGLDGILLSTTLAILAAIAGYKLSDSIKSLLKKWV